VKSGTFKSDISGTFVSDTSGTFGVIYSDQLTEDYKKGILKGKLKEIAATLREDSNPVIMLIKHKK